MNYEIPIERPAAAFLAHIAWRMHVQPDPDVPEDPDRDDDLPDVNPGSNPENPGDQPAVREPGRPPDVVALGGTTNPLERTALTVGVAPTPTA